MIEVLALGRGIFPLNFCKMALVHPCSMSIRLHRLARSLRREFCLLLVCGLLPVNCGIKWPLSHVHVSTAQARAKQVSRAPRARQFPCRFPRKMALVTLPCAFRLCRLAQSVGRGLRMHLGRGIYLVNSCASWLF